MIEYVVNCDYPEGGEMNWSCPQRGRRWLSRARAMLKRRDNYLDRRDKLGKNYVVFILGPWRSWERV